MFKRSAILFFILAGYLCLMCVRISLIEEGLVSTASGLNNSVSVTASFSRGMIYDRNTEPLVNRNTVDFIAVKPDISAYYENAEFIKSEQRKTVLDEITEGRIGFAEAEKSVDTDSNLLFKAVKRYSDDDCCVHLVGYTDSDGHGVSGLEKYYDTLLSENSGSLKLICSVDARSNSLKGEKMKLESNNYSSAAGVATTIDTHIQRIAEDALKKYDIKKGAVVVLKSDTSEILALASVPVFDRENLEKSLEDNNSPFINRAITPYSVGSVFKAVVAAAAIENGADIGFSYNCSGEYVIGENSFGCHKREGHGELDMAGAMAASCNPYFINLALTTGKEKICEMGKRLGLGTQIELCDGWLTQSGIMPESDELVSKQDLANLAFGQGRLMASPLQMAAVYAAVANGGVYRRPSLMKYIIDDKGEIIMQAELPAPRRVMKESTAKKVGSLLKHALEETGSGKMMPEKLLAAGKTATAQTGQFKDNGEEIIQSWFCGYFPYEKPEYTVVVFKEDGKGGTSDCAPVFKYIVDTVQ